MRNKLIIILTLISINVFAFENVVDIDSVLDDSSIEYINDTFEDIKTLSSAKPAFFVGDFSDEYYSYANDKDSFVIFIDYTNKNVAYKVGENNIKRFSDAKCELIKKELTKGLDSSSKEKSIIRSTKLIKKYSLLSDFEIKYGQLIRILAIVGVLLVGIFIPVVKAKKNKNGKS